jgi:hypothetical protein
LQLRPKTISKKACSSDVCSPRPDADSPRSLPSRSGSALREPEKQNAGLRIDKEKLKIHAESPEKPASRQKIKAKTRRTVTDSRKSDASRRKNHGKDT